MVKYAKKIADNDNVATAVADFSGGDEATVRFSGNDDKYTCNQDVPFGHKIAIADINAGEKVFKYGESIGTASADIKVGDWVHTHNVKDDYKCLDKEGNPLPGQEDE
ncbi:MAG: UxaA family hydrolase [Desulfobacterales bacterium]|nr:UxaA family hydrolase [Desulfobacterales bacterium]